jgi:hypothetical protein
MRGRWTIAGAALAVLLAATIGAATENVTMTFCRQVAGRDPVGEAVSFSADVGWIYCHITLDNPQAPTQIHHDGTTRARTSAAVRWRWGRADVGAPSRRRKSARRGSARGRWWCATPTERELARKSFTVTPAP